MILNITGSTKTTRAMVTSTAAFGMIELGLRSLSSLKINIKLINMPTGNYGLCSANDEDDKPWQPMRNFTIEVNKNMGISMIVRTVLHELVHVKQFARGELDSKYKGMRWKTAHVTDDVDYMDLPWEKEAYKMEEKLAAKFWRENLI
jgi:hypothetical protein